MSEDLRKHCRTQGKYSERNLHYDDKGSQKNRDKRLKVSPGAREPLEKKIHKRKSDGGKESKTSVTHESESSVRYQENSGHSFSQLEEPKKPIEIRVPGRHSLSVTENGESFVLYDPCFFEKDEAEELFDSLYESTDWQSKNIIIHGEEFPQPRLVAWYGPFPYTYSGATLEPAEMPDSVLWIKERIEDYLKSNGKDISFNSVLLNLYRNNKDSVSWHSDDELSMGVCPTIASISLGEVRKFEMRRKVKRYGDESCDKKDEYFVHLQHGSLIIMDGCMQQDWQHRVPKDYHDRDKRINLTFRTVYEFTDAPSIPGTRSGTQSIDTATKESNKSKFVIQEENFPPLSAAVPPARSNIAGKMLDRSSDLKTDNGSQKVHKGENTEPSFDSKNNVVSTVDLINASEPMWEIDKPPYIQNALKVDDEMNQSETYSDIESPSNNNNNSERVPLNDFNHDSKNVKADVQNRNVHDYDASIPNNGAVNVMNSAENEESGSKESCNVSVNSQINAEENAFKDENKFLPTSSNKWMPNVEAKVFVPLNAVSTLGSDNAVSTLDGDNAVSTLSDDNAVSTLGSDNVYISMNLENLRRHDLSAMSYESLMEYSLVLKDRILNKMHDFKYYEQEELKLLCEITDRSQTEKNQRIITERMLNIIARAYKHHRSSPNDRKLYSHPRQSSYGNQSQYSERKYTHSFSKNYSFRS